MSAFGRHWINSTSSHPIVPYSILVLPSFISQGFSKRFLYCCFSDKVLQPLLTATCTKTRQAVSHNHISNTRHSSSVLMYISLETLLLMTSTLFWWTKELMGDTTVRGEWKTSNLATRPTHRIVSVVSCTILQVPPISYLYKFIYAKLRRSYFVIFFAIL